MRKLNIVILLPAILGLLAIPGLSYAYTSVSAGATNTNVGGATASYVHDDINSYTSLSDILYTSTFTESNYKGQLDSDLRHAFVGAHGDYSFWFGTYFETSAGEYVYASEIQGLSDPTVVYHLACYNAYYDDMANAYGIAQNSVRQAFISYPGLVEDSLAIKVWVSYFYDDLTINDNTVAGAIYYADQRIVQPGPTYATVIGDGLTVLS